MDLFTIPIFFYFDPFIVLGLKIVVLAFLYIISIYNAKLLYQSTIDNCTKMLNNLNNM